MQIKKTKLIIFSIVSFIAGAQLPLAFAPFNHFILAFIAPAILLALWLYATPKQAFWYGLLFGLGFFGFGTYWTYISIYTFGNAPLALAIFLSGLLILALASFPAINGYILTKFFPRNNLTKLLLVFPASWVILEWCRIWVLSGFPWLFMGYSQLQTPLSNIAPILGVYGVSFLALVTSGAIVALFSNKIWRILIAAGILILVWGGCILLKGAMAGSSQTAPTGGSKITVTLIQGNIPEQEKWDPKNLNKILALYKNITEEHSDSKIIIWPEGAIPIFDWQAKPFLDQLDKWAQQNNTNIVTGIPIQNPKTGKYYNGMLALGLNNSVYKKRHLVPFGEYLMLAPVSNWIVNYFHIPMSNFTPGAKQQPDFKVNNLYTAPSICYEVAYPTENLSYFPKAEFLLNITDDSWFGKSIAAYQQLQMAQMRSKETQRYQLIATNTGITAIVNPNGTIQKQAPMFKKAVISGYIYPLTNITPWVKFGYYLWLILMLLFVLIGKIMQLK